MSKHRSFLSIIERFLIHCFEQTGSTASAARSEGLPTQIPLHLPLNAAHLQLQHPQAQLPLQPLGNDLMQLNASQSTAIVNEAGDWKCPRCSNLNFAQRTRCNMRSCREPRPDNGRTDLLVIMFLIIIFISKNFSFLVNQT